MSYRWPARTEAKARARTSRGRYRCAYCQQEWGPKEIQLDHILPVVAINGLNDWNNIVERMFCDASGLQILCLQCHRGKSKKESASRGKSVR